MYKNQTIIAVIIMSCLNYALAQGLQIIGTSGGCGQDNIGTIFKYDLEENEIDTLFNFVNHTPGGFPISQKMIEADNGNLYGMTNQGGYEGLGVIFEYNPSTNSYKSLHDFRGLDGSTPFGSLFQASNGKLYGMTQDGGEFDNGVLFEYDLISFSYLKLIDFDGALGRSPYGDLIEAKPEQLFGLTNSGGDNNRGVLFKYDIIVDSIEVLYHLNDENGSRPNGSLIQLGNLLFGNTDSGGDEDLGTIFKYDLDNNEFSKLFDFTEENGEDPMGFLTLGPNGSLYGTTFRGGPLEDFGLIFEFNPVTNEYNIRYEFIGINGSTPSGHMLLASNNKFYGITRRGGDENDGVLYEFNPANNFYLAKIYFGNNPEFESNTNLNGLVEHSNGKIYGITANGGNYGAGVIFQYEPSNNEIQKKIDFDYMPNGAYPQFGLIKGSDGNYYGTNSFGGEFDYGVLYKFNLSTNGFSKLHDFNGINGRQPSGTPMEANNNKHYGVTKFGGSNDEGILYQYDPISNETTSVLDFADVTSSRPIGSLLQASNGLIYGVTEGSSGESGVVYTFNIQTAEYSAIHEFNFENGFSPNEGLIEANNGLLYSTTFFGGDFNKGVFYSIDINNNNAYKKIKEFSDNDSLGYYTNGKLTVTSDGSIYGVNRAGGVGVMGGVLYKYDPNTNIITPLFDFELDTGHFPIGGLLLASNEKLYGSTRVGGDFDNGILYEYDIANNLYSIIQSYPEEICGVAPNLIEILPPSNTNDFLTAPNNYVVFPNPAINAINIKNNLLKISHNKCFIEIYDNLGKQHLKKFIDFGFYMDETITLNISDLQNGFYFIKITDSSDRVNFIKFIKL